MVHFIFVNNIHYIKILTHEHIIPHSHILKMTLRVITPDIDASGKPGSGILDGNIQWFGSFEQCLKFPVSHYCLVSLDGIFSANSVSLELDRFNTTLVIFLNLFFLFSRTDFSKSQIILYGICVPDECNNKDVAIGFQVFFKNG